MIAIINSGGANLASIIFALERLNAKVKVTTDAQEIKKASHVILPGVGAASTAINRLKASVLIDVIRNLKQPALGICLGMQLLYAFSSEGNVDCLNILSENISQLKSNKNVRVPHMGWNTLQIKKETPLLKNIAEKDYFYFVHSFIAPINNYTCAQVNYGELFSAVVQKDNFFATQFHPERSSKSGALLLRNFLEL